MSRKTVVKLTGVTASWKRGSSVEASQFAILTEQTGFKSRQTQIQIDTMESLNFSVMYSRSRTFCIQSIHTPIHTHTYAVKK